MISNRLNIVLSTDEHYVVPTSVVIKSVVENNKDLNIDFFVFATNLEEWEEKSIECLQSAMGDEGGFVLHLMKMDPIDELCRKYHIPKYKNSYGIFVKLFMADIIQSDANILWLDSDTVVVDSLLPLTNMNDRGGCWACLDTMNSAMWKSAIGMDPNSVIGLFACFLICPEIWKKEGKLQKIVNWIHQFKEEAFEEIVYSIVCDQGLISAALQEKGDWEVLPARYQLLPGNYLMGKYLYRLYNLNEQNYYSWNELLEAKEDPCIIHYMHYIVPKPWFHDELNMYEDVWVSYYNQLGEYRELFPLSNYDMSTMEKIKRFLFLYAKWIFIFLGNKYIKRLSSKTKRLLVMSKL